MTYQFHKLLSYNVLFSGRGFLRSAGRDYMTTSLLISMFLFRHLCISRIKDKRHILVGEKVSLAFQAV